VSLLKIAVADDYKDDLNILKNYISDCLKDTCNNIDLFEDGETLLTEFEPNKYDIVFLDIYMRETTGIDVARKIFETDKNCKIIFITTSNSFATESYEVEASGYLIKPVDKAQIKKLLNKCLKDIKKSTKYVDFISGKYAYHIAFKDIIYIGNALRTVRIHLYNRIIELDEGFHKKTAPILEDDRFIECCRCVIVNMEHIVKIQKDDFLMDNSENVPIRKRNRKEIHKAYIKYKLGGM
jgi:DNA-binding LytR/AlgR family response regulator